MTKLKEAKAKPWRNSNQLRGIRSQLQRAITSSSDGAYIEVDNKTAYNLLEICDQCIQTEKDTGYDHHTRAD